MTKHDRAALTLAMETCRAESEGRAWQLDEKLKDESWEEVASFAAFCSQGESLALQPWENPPCIVDEDDDGEVDAAAVKLLRQMLAAGISRYHPDPLGALEQAKRKGAA